MRKRREAFIRSLWRYAIRRIAIELNCRRQTVFCNKTSRHLNLKKLKAMERAKTIFFRNVFLRAFIIGVAVAFF
jgi:hypothetical protein